LLQSFSLSSVIETDVLIVGAGPAGSATALFLAQKGIKSVLTDKAKFPRDKICGDALSGKVVEVLNKLDTNLALQLNQDKKFIGSWGVTFVAPNGKSLRVPFNTRKEKKHAPGFIARRMDFDNWLIQRVKENEHIHLHEETEIRDYARSNERILATAKNGESFDARIVIGCDGAYSSIAKDLGGLKTEPAHNCFGLRAYYKGVTGLDTDNFIELHFLKEFLPGYFWIFPLPGGYANVGVGMRADKMNAKKANLKKSFEAILENNALIKSRFEKAEQIGEIKQFGLPLGSKKRKLSGDNYMLCGDAGMLIDPFTGEGIGNAMISGMYAAAQAEKCLAAGNYSSDFINEYDLALYRRLWPELLLSYRMQQLVNFPSLFNFVVNKANSNKVLSETISCMFEDLDMRSRLKSPQFYLKLLFS
jgi:geranylgeranyl reductase family protein